MKTYGSVISLLLFVNVLCYSQIDYRVIRVDGVITIRSSGVNLATGTVFSENENLLFRTAEATAAVINPEKGRMILTAPKGDLSNTKSNFMPSMYNISSRGGSLNNLIDLQNHFSGRYVILDRLALQVNKSSFPMDNTHFFFLRYKYKNEDINKKLEFSADSIIFDKASLYTVDGNPIPSPDNTKIKLFYRNGEESILIGEFDLIFPDTKQLKEEVSVIISGMKGKPENDVFDQVTSYINEFYGKPNKDNLQAWLARNFVKGCNQ
jgi:hypothetical protein